MTQHQLSAIGLKPFGFQRILTLAPLLETAIIQLALAELLAGCAAKIISVAGKQC